MHVDHDFLRMFSQDKRLVAFFQCSVNLFTSQASKLVKDA